MRQTVVGIVSQGQGQGRAFTQLDWVRRQFRDRLGFDPYPGTLNLRVKDVETLAAWRAHPGIPITPMPGFCSARCFRVQLDARVSAAWIIPDVSGYPADLVELIAPVSLRDALGVRTGDAVTIQLAEDQS